MDARTVEQTLQARHLPDVLPTEEGWVLPHYAGLSIGNLAATISALFGSPMAGALPPLPDPIWTSRMPDLRRIILIVLDALGYRSLQKGDYALQQAPHPVKLLGRHGGLSPEEMLVPLVGCRLEALP